MRRAVTNTLRKLGVDTAAIGLQEERNKAVVENELLLAERKEQREAQAALNEEGQKTSQEVMDIMRQAQAEIDRIAADESMSESEKAAAIAAVRVRSEVNNFE